MIAFGIFLYTYILCLFIITIGKMSDIMKSFCMIGASAVLLCIVTFRPLEVPDTLSYKKIFEIIDTQRDYGFQLWNKEYSTGVEYGFLLVSQFLKKFITNKFRIYLAFCSIIVVLLYTNFVRVWCENDVRKKVYLFYFTIPYLGLMYLCVPIRTGIAMAVAINAFILNQKKKFPVKVTLYYLGFLFHRSIIVFIFIEMVYNLMPILKKKVYIALWLINGLCIFGDLNKLYQLSVYILNFFASKFSFLRYQHYFDESLLSSALSMRRLFLWSIGLVFFVFFDSLTSKKSKKMLNVYIMGLFIMNITSFISGASRIYDYFLISLPLLLTEIYSNKEIVGKTRTIIWGVELLYGIGGVSIILRL